MVWHINITISDNCRGICLFNAICKLFDNAILVLYRDELHSSDMQFGYKQGHATVNQASISLINAAWKKRLNMLYCHFHPLDTIASDIKKRLRTLEDSKDSRRLSSVGCVAEKVLAAFDTVLTRQYRTYLELCDEDKEKMAKETGNIFKFISVKHRTYFKSY